MFEESWALAADFARRAPRLAGRTAWQFPVSDHSMVVRSDTVPGPGELVAGGVVTEFARLGLRSSQWSCIVRSVPVAQDARVIASLTVGVPEAPSPWEEFLIGAVRGEEPVDFGPAEVYEELRARAGDLSCWLRVVPEARLPELAGDAAAVWVFGSDRDEPTSRVRCGRLLASFLLTLGSAAVEPYLIGDERTHAAVRRAAGVIGPAFVAAPAARPVARRSGSPAVATFGTGRRERVR